MREAGVQMGRDRFFEMLGRYGLKVGRLAKRPKTTQSRHSLPVFSNLLMNVEVKAPGEVWVSDLTYVRTQEGFCYLAVVMDLYSRKIVGYHVGENLETASCMEALEMALGELAEGARPIHHSDRGCQYCSHAYVSRLQELGFRISMTQENHCYENAHAERVIGILKEEYGLWMTYRNREHVKQAVEQAVHVYNTKRLHTSLGYRTPAEVHRCVA